MKKQVLHFFQRSLFSTAAIFHCLTFDVRAAEGDVDTSFGDQGIAALVSIPLYSYFPMPPLIDADGKIVACGEEETSDREVFGYVFRFMPDGLLDAAFGERGRVHVPTNISACTSVQDQSDGKFVISGNFPTGSHEPPRFVSKLVSIDARGMLDLTFGVDGSIDVDLFPGGDDSVEAMSVQRDDSVVLASPSFPNTFGVVRVIPDGSFDPAFGDDGLAQVIFPGIGQTDVRTIYLDDRGRITLVGSVGIEGTEKVGFAATRLLPNGQLDASFGNGGRALFELSDTAPLIASAQAADGSILMAGAMKTEGTTRIALLRMSADGLLDTLFGDNGSRVLSVNGINDTINGAVITADGSIVLAGFTITQDAQRQGLVIKLDHHGDPISAFGANGVKTYSFLNGRTYFAGIAPQGRDFIVYAVAYPDGEYGGTFFLTRLEGAAPALGHSRHARR